MHYYISKHCTLAFLKTSFSPVSFILSPAMSEGQVKMYNCMYQMHLRKQCPGSRVSLRKLNPKGLEIIYISVRPDSY